MKIVYWPSIAAILLFYIHKIETSENSALLVVGKTFGNQKIDSLSLFLTFKEFMFHMFSCFFYNVLTLMFK